MDKKTNYHIITSCDENLLNQVSVLIYSISRNLNNAHTDFYVITRITYDEKFEMMNALCNKLGNITFHNIIVPDAELYDELGKYGGGWVGEAYFSLCAHLFKEFENVDRVLYLDAGDVIVVNDIAEYYNSDFNDKSLIAHSIRYKAANNIPVTLDQSDLQNENFEAIARGLFNSGSYVMNLDKMRKDGLSIDDYLYVRNVLVDSFGEENHKIYWGDQGLLSIAFVGDINIYRYNEIRNIWYMPYNFCMWYYDRMNQKPDYEPAVIHYAGNAKPWQIEYPVYLERFQKNVELHKTSELKLGQGEWYYLWHEYAMITDNMLTELGY